MTQANQTLSRLLRRDGSLLVNPFFEWMSQVGDPADARRRAAGHLVEGVANQFYYSPGWYMFGAYPHTSLDASSSAARASGPFAANGNAGNGVKIRQFLYESTTRTIHGGLVQPIPRARNLVGRRVRITGAFYVDEDAGHDAPGTTEPVPCGVSIWLKGRVRSGDIVEPATPSDYAGDVLAAPGDEINEFGGPNIGNFAIHDMLIVGAQYDPGTVEDQFQPGLGVYAIQDFNGPQDGHIYHNYLTTGLSAASPPGGTPYVGAAESEGEFVTAGLAAARLSTTTHTVGFVATVQPAGLGLPYDSESFLFHRGWDFLQAPLLEDGFFEGPLIPDPLPFVALMWGRYQSNVKDQGAGGTGTGTYLDRGGREIQNDNGYTLYYVDTDEWTDDPLDGNIELYVEETTVDGVIHYFDEIVEIPDDFVMDQDEAFLICLVKNPNTAPPTYDTFFVQYVEVSVLALDIELLPDDGNISADNPLEDRFLRKFLQGTGGGTASVSHAGLPLDFMLRYPIYKEVAYPLDVHSMVANQDALGEATFDSGGGPALVEIGLGTPAEWGPYRYVFNQPNIPPGGHILRAAYYVVNYSPGLDPSSADWTDGDSQLVNIGASGQGASLGSLYNVICERAQPTPNNLPFTNAFQDVGSDLWDGNFALGFGDRLPNRHRLGFPEPAVKGQAGEVYPSASKLLLTLEVETTVVADTGFNLQLGTGYLIAWVDPRLGDGYMIQWGDPH